MYTHACNLLLARKRTFFQNVYLIVHLSENFSLAPITNILSKRNNISIWLKIIINYFFFLFSFPEEESIGV